MTALPVHNNVTVPHVIIEICHHVKLVIDFYKEGTLTKYVNNLPSGFLTQLNDLICLSKVNSKT